MINIKSDYKDLIRDIWMKKDYFIFSLVLLVASVYSCPFFPDIKELLITILKDVIVSHIHAKPAASVILFIFLKNSTATFASLFLGLFFSVLPIIAVVFNGLLAGAVLRDIPLNLYWTILPHGIFEIPAFFIAVSYGTWLGLWPLRKNRFQNVKNSLKESMVIYVRIILPLLIVAAVIEGTLIKFL